MSSRAPDGVTGNPSRRGRYIHLCNQGAQGASLDTIRTALRELEPVTLADSLRYVLAHADEPDGDYTRVAARWAAMLVRETQCDIAYLKRTSHALWVLPSYPYKRTARAGRRLRRAGSG